VCDSDTAYAVGDMGAVAANFAESPVDNSAADFDQYTHRSVPDEAFAGYNRLCFEGFVGVVAAASGVGRMPSSTG
jgi:hypothetical protein